ncbi:hypothetical protein B9Z55_009036 [Caenorhabditis nigoni]|uniref:F-box domain-containing protein n=1 Tax=Caenorhabditis nigoni TaxID=1611254 RepID=A0A2G5UQ80_9PELO|nr:hypothetical protein B9Z55_009036 [Caenorhabditis nigoni]
MKLSKYPNVVHKEVFDNLETWDLILLSFVSKNMKKVVKSSQTNRFKNISRIVYSYGGFRDRMVYTPAKTNHDYINVRIRKQIEEVSILKMIERQDSNSSQWNVAGKRIDYE